MLYGALTRLADNIALPLKKTCKVRGDCDLLGVDAPVHRQGCNGRPIKPPARPGDAPTNDTVPASAAKPRLGLSMYIPNFLRRLAVRALATAIPPSAQGPH